MRAWQTSGPGEQGHGYAVSYHDSSVCLFVAGVGFSWIDTAAVTVKKCGVGAWLRKELPMALKRSASMR